MKESDITSFLLHYYRFNHSCDGVHYHFFEFDKKYSTYIINDGTKNPYSVGWSQSDFIFPKPCIHFVPVRNFPEIFNTLAY